MSTDPATSPSRPTRFIGPLTAAEWASFRLRDGDGDGDLLQCCAVTSEFRDAVFDLLRNADTVYDQRGNVMPAMVNGFRAAYWAMHDHGLPGGYADELIARLARHYLGDPPAPATDLDRMHSDQLYAELCHRSGQPAVNVRPSRFSVCALPEGHQAYRYLVIHVDLTGPYLGEIRWAVRWGGYRLAFDDNFDRGDWEVDASRPDDVDRGDWVIHREFRFTWAMRVAQEQATKVTVGGLTAAEIIARDNANRVKA